jgi:hypothetical protein
MRLLCTSILSALLLGACLPRGSFAAEEKGGGRGTLGLNAGIATGDNGIGLGWIVGANYLFAKKWGPLKPRVDVTYQDHGSDMKVFALSANAIVPVRRVYALAGVGWYDTDPGGSPVEITLGLGLHRRGRTYLEARWVNIDGFTTFPIEIGLQF